MHSIQISTSALMLIDVVNEASTHAAEQWKVLQVSIHCRLRLRLRLLYYGNSSEGYCTIVTCYTIMRGHKKKCRKLIHACSGWSHCSSQVYCESESLNAKRQWKKTSCQPVTLCASQSHKQRLTLRIEKSKINRLAVLQPVYMTLHYFTSWSVKFTFYEFW
jgi:hypothetical protein